MKLSDFTIQSIQGEPLDWSKFDGKKIILVNVASECGLTPQYKQLEELYQTYSEKVEVIGVPCNDFGAQEPGTSEEIVQFCTKNYGVTFQLTEKISVQKPNWHSIYEWLINETGQEVTWNFQKFLIDEKGNVVKSIAPTVNPLDVEITNWINS